MNNSLGMNLSIKKEKKSILQIEIFSFLILSSMMFFSTSISTENINSVFGQTAEDEDQLQKLKNNNNNNEEDLTTIKVKINKNNIDVENYDRIKIVGYLNGEGQTKYIDLKKEFEKKVNPNENSLSLDLKFNKSNDISSTMVDDEYYVCAYGFDIGKVEEKEDNLTASAIPLYDCDEGNIGTSTTKDTVTLFSTMKKYGESKAFYTANQNTKPADISNPTKEVKITINVPIYDAKDIDDMNVIAMVKGDYKIKTIDVQNELEENGNTNKGQISVLFTFDRETEVGYIQPGDLFFGCATSDEFPNQNSDCEKKMIKDLDKISKLCARKDNSC